MLQYKEPLSKRNKAETGIRYEWYAMQRWGAKYWEDYDVQCEDNKNTNREGVFIQIPRARALASKKLLSYCINVYDFC